MALLLDFSQQILEGLLNCTTVSEDWQRILDSFPESGLPQSDLCRALQACDECGRVLEAPPSVRASLSTIYCHTSPQDKITGKAMKQQPETPHDGTLAKIRYLTLTGGPLALSDRAFSACPIRAIITVREVLGVILVAMRVDASRAEAIPSLPPKLHHTFAGTSGAHRATRPGQAKRKKMQLTIEAQFGLELVRGFKGCSCDAGCGFARSQS